MHGQMGVGRAVLAAILSLLSPLGVLADERDFCTSPVVTYASVIERVAPAIVSINLRSPVGLDPSRASRAKGEREEIGAFGSGVIIDPSGLIATTSHGLERNWPITVVLNDQRELDAEIVLTDRRTDLAILRIKGSQDFATVQLGNSDEVRVGDLVLAIGNPYAVGQTVTHGLVSAVGRTQLQINNYEYYIQTDAAINPGSSGGALLDARGRLIGINMAIVSQTRGWQGIGFAVPVNMVAFVADAARRGTDVIRRAWLGAKLVPLDPGTVARLKLNSAIGALVRSVVANSPAEQAGLQVNDVISSIDG
ncbi:MAG: trypsin-like peptidase domain-containing protein, partial [Pseudolabrys sp.]